LAIDVEKDGILAVSFCPGWVQTDMGGEKAALTPQESVSALLTTTFQLTNEYSGGYFRRTGDRIPY
jgi:NAD(P)-dependent dehydrogenase (short-subunit alcohol dehydrogenase family)